MTLARSLIEKASPCAPEPIAPASSCAFRRHRDLPASFALYNTFEEVDKLAEALIKAEGLLLDKRGIGYA